MCKNSSTIFQWLMNHNWWITQNGWNFVSSHLKCHSPGLHPEFVRFNTKTVNPLLVGVLYHTFGFSIPLRWHCMLYDKEKKFCISVISPSLVMTWFAFAWCVWKSKKLKNQRNFYDLIVNKGCKSYFHDKTGKPLYKKFFIKNS